MKSVLDEKLPGIDRLTVEIFKDELALSLARALAAANKRARKAGIDIKQSHIIIAQVARNGKHRWEISYGPKDYINQRGAEFIIEVDADRGRVVRTWHGQ